MATITIRNVDDSVVAGLKSMAKANRRSLEGEIHHLLVQQASKHGRHLDFRERTERLVYLSADRPQSDSAAFLREDRDR